MTPQFILPMAKRKPLPPPSYKSLFIGMIESLNVLGEDMNSIARVRGKEAAYTRVYSFTFLSVFAVELGLKALRERQGMDPMYTHDLWKLYKTLPEEPTRRSLGVTYSGLFAPEGDRITVRKVSTLEGYVRIHRESFERWRYLELRDNDMSYPRAHQIAVAALLRELDVDVKLRTIPVARDWS